MPIDKEKLQLLEVKIESGYSSCGKQIMDLGLSENVIIGCIVRGNNTFVPNGRTEIRKGDMLMIVIVTNRVSQEMVLTGLIEDIY
ncbi:MAG: TrkA-C domain [Clostridiales bacterium]|jgi:trk system potassium uptake protein TrkA|nr:TrkA-C domain [Clostridiales bacterium]